ncbi:hypothetical protein [Aeromonas intestinalis]
MLEKLKGFLDLKAVILVLSIFGTCYVAYTQVGQHEIRLNIYQDKLITLEKNELKVDSRIDVLEKAQDKTDGQLEKLNQTLNELNLSLVRLASTLENMNKKEGS